MNQLLISPASPYSAKVAMAAHYANYPFERVVVNTSQLPDHLINANPLGKIPTLISEDHGSIFDSRTIMHYLDRLSGGILYPVDTDARLSAEKLESAADGLCDALVAHVYERIKRPEEKVHQEWLDWQWDKAERCLDYLEDFLTGRDSTADNITGGHLALAAALGYLSLRFGTEWSEQRPNLKRWFNSFKQDNEETAKYLPHNA